MRRVRYAVLTLALLVASGVAWAEGGKFPLKPAETPDSTTPLAAQASYEVIGKDKMPAGCSGPPPVISRRLAYFTAHVGTTTLLMAMDYSSKGSKLFVDANANGDLSDEAPLTGRLLRTGRQLFPMIMARGSGDRKIPVRLEAGGPKYLMIYPAAMMCGTARLDGRSYRVFLLDGNLDGEYGTVFSTLRSRFKRATSDCLGIDLNNNRAFDAEVGGVAEVMPLPGTVAIGGKWYRVTVAADGSEIGLSEVQAETGTLGVSAACADVLLQSDKGSYRLCGGRTRCEVPAGTYRVAEANLVKHTGQGVVWTMVCETVGAIRPLVVAKGEAAVLTVGEPLIGKVDIRKDDEPGTLSLGFEIYGVGDERYEPRAYRNGRKQPTPRFRIVDEGGRQVGVGDFANVDLGTG